MCRKADQPNIAYILSVPGWTRAELPDPTTLDPAALVLALLSALMIFVLKQGMGRTESIWNELNVIGVTEGIYNDTVAISKASQYYTPEIVAALQDCFINIINTDEGKAIFDVYSHTGYAKATDADYDGARAALKAVSD